MERPNPKPSSSGLSGTGGAIPVRNEKGKIFTVAVYLTQLKT